MKRLLLLSALLFSAVAQADKPRLIVQITVDQLRGDLLFRYQHNFINQHQRKGFHRFLSEGTLFTNSHYNHAATLTAVGHSTLATGATPDQHGVIGNNWYDVATQSDMYCVADKQTQLLNAEGRSASPKNLMASTFSDQLHLATNGKAKIYSVSVKDRGAILTGGHFGKSFWMDKNKGNFISSSYYYDELPQWATQFNQSGRKDQHIGQQWTLSKAESAYVNSTKNQLYQIPPKGFSRGFPHGLPAEKGKSYYKALAYTPFADQLTADFAKMLVQEHQLGSDEITDYLAVSFSMNDYIGHRFGPNSREAEDGLYRLDQTLADFFQFLDQRIGLENVLLAISADHGVDAIPEYKKALGFAGIRGDVTSKITKFANDYQQKHNAKQPLLFSARLPNVYLNHKAIAEANLSFDKVLKDFEKELNSYPAVGRVYRGRDLQTGNIRKDAIGQRVLNNFVDGRSGDLIIVQDTSSMKDIGSAATHGSPYRYDTHVPLYFAGWKVTAKRITRETSPEDLAITLAATLNIGHPDRATGKILAEIAEL